MIKSLFMKSYGIVLLQGSEFAALPFPLVKCSPSQELCRSSAISDTLLREVQTTLSGFIQGQINARSQWRRISCDLFHVLLAFDVEHHQEYHQ